MTATPAMPAIRRDGVRGSLLAAALLVLLAACSPSGLPSDGSPPAASPGGPASPSPAAPTAAPTPVALSPRDGPPTEGRFPIVSYQGDELLGAEELDFTELLGRGVPIALNFWAGQCPPCRAEMPAFQDVYDRHSHQFLLVGVDIGPFIGLGSHKDARALLTELGITYPAAYAVDDRAVRDYFITQMPTTVFYTADGEEHTRHDGPMTEQQFEEAVRQIVAAGG